MRSMVLLNFDGTIAKKLHFSKLPDDYEVPAKTRVSVRSEHDYFYHSNLFGRIRQIPNQAHFFYYDADGIIEIVDRPNEDPKSFRVVRITVQGNIPKNINDLYFYLLGLIQSDSRVWGVINHPKDASIKQNFLKKILK